MVEVTAKQVKDRIRSLTYDEGRRWERLGTYNAEKARGILHTREWVEFMAAEQAAFEAWRDRCMAEHGYYPVV